MLDGVSLDQLRTFIAAVDEGSFSAASRRLRRAQSVVSQTVSNLEQQIGVALFDRSGRYPKLTAAGGVLLADARNVVSGVDVMKARARGMAGGLEPELSAVIDVFYPMEAFTEAAKDFQSLFPGTALRLFVEAIGAAYQPVLDGRCSLGIAGPLPLLQPSLTSERLTAIELVMVAARDHPLASVAKPIPQSEARVPAQRPRLGRHAAAHGGGGYRQRQARRAADRGRAGGRPDPSHDRHLPDGCATWTCWPLADRTPESQRRTKTSAGQNRLTGRRSGKGRLQILVVTAEGAAEAGSTSYHLLGR